jgi:catalase
VPFFERTALSLSRSSAGCTRLALKFFAGNGETDLLVTNEDGRLHARNVVSFMDFADAFLGVQLSGMRLRGVESLFKAIRRGTLPLQEALVGMGILTKATSHPVESAALETYVGSVVRLGDVALRHVLRPVRSAPGGTFADRSSANFLREDLESRLVRFGIKFELCVQLFTDEKTTAVNDATVKWTSPFVRVGEVQFTQTSNPEDKAFISRLAFNPCNGFGALGINHARLEAYKASALERGALMGDAIREHFVAKNDGFGSSAPDVFGARSEPR